MNLISLALSLFNPNFVGLVLIVSLILSPLVIFIIKKKIKEKYSMIVCSILSSVVTAIYIICCFLFASVLMLFNDTGAKLNIVNCIIVYGLIFLFGSVIYLPVLFTLNGIALFIINQLKLNKS